MDRNPLIVRLEYSILKHHTLVAPKQIFETIHFVKPFLDEDENASVFPVGANICFRCEICLQCLIELC